MSGKGVLRHPPKKKLAYRSNKPNFHTVEHRAADYADGTANEQAPSRITPTEFKRRCNYDHALFNAKERQGITQEVFDLAIRTIELCISEDIKPSFKNGVLKLRPDHRGKHRTLWAVLVNSQAYADGGFATSLLDWAPIVYDHVTKSPVSVLPHHVLDDYAHLFSA